MRFYILFFALPLVSSHALAQTIFDNCKTIITGGLRGYSIAADSYSALNTIFDNYCDSSGSVKTDKLGIGTDIVVSSIPIKFAGPFGSTSQAISNFCINYQIVYNSQSNKNSYQERIVQRAYDSFDMCIVMAQSGVVAEHTVESISRVNFYLAPAFGHPVTVRGVSATSNMVCKGQDPDAAAPVEITFNGSSRLVLSDKTLGMVCTRQPTKDAADNSIFDEAIATVLTDVPPNGNYTIFMPRDTTLAENQASSLSNKMKTLNEQYKALTEKFANISLQLSKIQDASVDDVINGTNSIGSGIPGNRNRMPPYLMDPDLDQPQVKCPPGSFVSAIQAFKIPVPSPKGLVISDLRYTCRSVTK